MHVAAARACGELRPQHGCEQTGPRAKGSAGDANSFSLHKKSSIPGKDQRKGFFKGVNLCVPCSCSSHGQGGNGIRRAGAWHGIAPLPPRQCLGACASAGSVPHDSIPNESLLQQWRSRNVTRRAQHNPERTTSHRHQPLQQNQLSSGARTELQHNRNTTAEI